MPETSIREFVEAAFDPKVRGFLHLPENSNGDGLVLTHGAGSSASAPLLVAVAETFSANGFTVLRCDLPSPIQIVRSPGPADASRDRAGLNNALGATKKNDLRQALPRRTFLWRTPIQHALRGMPRTQSRFRLLCFPTRCIHRASPSSSARSISPTCARRPCSFRVLAIPSARSPSWSKL